MYLVDCPGIGEHVNGQRMLNYVANAFPHWQRTTAPYKADYGPVGVTGPAGRSFDYTLRDGEAVVMRLLERGPTLLAGYSAGAAIAGNVAAKGHPNLRGVLLVADPFQPFGVTNNGKYGIAGSRRISGVPVYWVVNPLDMICQTPQFSPLRTIADQTRKLSLATPGEWSQDLLHRWLRNQWQPINFKFDTIVQQYTEAGRDLAGYLVPDGRGITQHTNYGVWRDQYGRTRLDYGVDWMRKFNG